MHCIRIYNGIVCLSGVDFSCPFCGKVYSDEKYLDRIEQNKCGYTKVRCDCGERFGVTYNYMSEMVTFKLTNCDLKSYL
jgi:hypothetical protein